MRFSFEQRNFTTRDGTPIGYQVAGVADAPLVLLCNGLGGNFHAYQPLVDCLGDRFHFVAWDYRGLFTSAPARRWLRGGSLPRDQLQVETHARDGLELLDREGFERFPIVAWSLGVQVALELYRLIPERITGMALLNGTSGELYRTVFGRAPYTDRWIPPLLRAIRLCWPVAQATVAATTRWSRLLDLAVGLGVLHPDINREAAGKVLRAFGDLDMRLYFMQLEELTHHDASDVLPLIRCPTLVITSDKDVFTPGFAGRRMASAIPGCETRNFAAGSHYAPIELGSAINAEIEAFLTQRIVQQGARSGVQA